MREAWRTGSRLDKFNATEIGKKAMDAGYSASAPLWYEDGQCVPFGDADEMDFGFKGRYRHPRFMPRWASRITLEITDVRVQRLQDISREDIAAEGVFDINCKGSTIAEFDWETRHFRELWQSINGRRAPWESNPYVWAITFAAIKAIGGAK